MFWSVIKTENDEKAETSSNTSKNEQEEAVECTEKDKNDQETYEENTDVQNGPESLKNDEKQDKEEDVSEKKSSKESSSSRYLNHRALFMDPNGTGLPVPMIVVPGTWAPKDFCSSSKCPRDS